MKHVKAIFFDFDGTLADTIPDIVESVNVMLKKLSLKEKSFDAIKSYIGRGQKELIHDALGSGHKNLFAEAYEIFNSYYSEHYTDHLVLYPGVKEILEYFKDKYLFLLTNKNLSFVERGLDIFDIRHFFKGIAAGDNKACIKPDTCAMDMIFKKYTIASRQALMVGDMHIDILTGRNAGTLTCGVTYGLGTREQLINAGADFVIDRLEQLKEHIQ